MKNNNRCSFSSLLLVISLVILPASLAKAKAIGEKKCGTYTQGQYGKRFDSTNPITKATIEPHGDGYKIKIILKNGEKKNILLDRKLVRQKTSDDNLNFGNYDSPISIKRDGSFILADSFTRHSCMYSGKIKFLNGAKARIFG